MPRQGASALSSELRRRSGKQAVAGLRFQAYPFSYDLDWDFSSLDSRAKDDECLLQIENEHRIARGPERRSNPVARIHSPTARMVSAHQSSDPQINQQLHLDPIKARLAWPFLHSPGMGLTDEQTVIVAVVDSGIDPDHEEFENRLWRNGAGQIGYDFENGDADPRDDNEHGTFVAGLIAANGGNSVGVTGLALSGVRLMIIKAVDEDGSGALSNIANGVRWAADQGADVINLSLGSDSRFDALEDAIRYASSKDIVITTAAGNDGRLISQSRPFIPATYSQTIPGLLTVTSVNSSNLQLSSFSNYSNTFVQVAAPGAVGILSTLPGGRYGTNEGTSFAAPLVAATAAMVIGVLRQNHADFRNSDVVNLILATSDRNASLQAYVQEGRFLNLQRLALRLQGDWLTDSSGLSENP
jgi:thermitase